MHSSDLIVFFLFPVIRNFLLVLIYQYVITSEYLKLLFNRVLKETLIAATHKFANNSNKRSANVRKRQKRHTY